MDENIVQNSSPESAQKDASPSQGGSAPEPVSYTRNDRSSPNFFDKFSSFFTKKTVVSLVILILVIGVGAATIAVQRSTEIRQRAATAPTPPCLIPQSFLIQLSSAVRGYGDVNGDGQVTSVDSSLILQYSGGLIAFSPVKIEAADVNGAPNVLSSARDVNSIDSSLILQYVAGLITTFPVCSSSPTPIVSPSGNVIAGTVFVDSNGNGVQDSAETDYSGAATIKLQNGTIATKFGNGYFFTGVSSGKHTVTLTLPSGYTSTTPTSSSVTVPPSPGAFKFGIKSGTVTPGPTTPPGVTVTPTPTRTPIPTVPPSSSLPCGSLGDVNGDGKINSIDSNLILQYSAGLISISGIIAANADVNGDGKINSIDSNLILQYSAGLISTFPACSTGSVISGTVYIDTNGNAVQDSGETDYSGNATIKLENGVTAVKFGTGYYFTGVASGSHTVTLTVPSGYTKTTPTSVSVTVPPSPGTFKFGIKSGTVTPGPTTPPGVTVTPTPEPTIPAGSTVLALTIGLDGIGTTGDNNTPNDSSGSNKDPERLTRNVTVELFTIDNENTPIAKKSGTINYNTESGKFTGNVNIENLESGTYIVKVKSDGYLRRRIPGQSKSIQAGETNTLALSNLVTGDINNDNAINILDYNILISCSIFSTDNQGLCNSNNQYKILSDLDDNGTINQLDYNLFVRELSVQNGD